MAESYRARIHWRDKLTGATGVYTEEPSSHGSLWTTDDDYDDLISVFQWSDGNYSCDCNRAILFLGTDYENAECGDSRFTILKLEALAQDADGPATDLNYSEEADRG